MQHARAFGASDRTRRVAEANAADPQKHYQYLQHKNAQQTRSVLAKAPRGSRVFSRSRNLEQTVAQREQAARQRAEEQAIAQRSAAQRMTRSFRPRQAAPYYAPAPAYSPAQQAKQQQVQQHSRAFGATRTAQRAQQQALAMELETPWSWQAPPQPEPQLVDEYGDAAFDELDDQEPAASWQADADDDDPMDCGVRFG